MIWSVIVVAGLEGGVVDGSNGAGYVYLHEFGRGVLDRGGYDLEEVFWATYPAQADCTYIFWLCCPDVHQNALILPSSNLPTLQFPPSQIPP